MKTRLHQRVICNFSWLIDSQQGDNMAKITKVQMQKEIKKLQEENASLKLEINNLNAKINYYQTIEKQIASIGNGCMQWIGGFLPQQDAKP